MEVLVDPELAYSCTVEADGSFVQQVETYPVGSQQPIPLQHAFQHIHSLGKRKHAQVGQPVGDGLDYY